MPQRKADKQGGVISQDVRRQQAGGQAPIWHSNTALTHSCTFQGADFHLQSVVEAAQRDSQRVIGALLKQRRPDDQASDAQNR